MNNECPVVERPPDDRLQMAELEPHGGNREYSSNRSGQLNNNDAGNERGALRSLTLLSSIPALPNTHYRMECPQQDHAAPFPFGYPASFPVPYAVSYAAFLFTDLCVFPPAIPHIAPAFPHAEPIPQAYLEGANDQLLAMYQHEQPEQNKDWLRELWCL